MLLLSSRPIFALVPSPNLSKLPTWAGELLETGWVAHLGLLDLEGGPRVLPVTYAVAGGRIWSAADSKPKSVAPGELARIRFLRRDPRAALTVDRYSDDWSELAWVQVLGEVEIVDAASGAEGLEALAAKYRPYRDSPPPGPLLALAPDRWLHWRAAEG
jgi:PPOX class probable F420-dependent enzyme